jgi:cell division protein FtsQ
MIRAITLQRVLFVLLWIGIATGMGFLLKAAWDKKGAAVCKGYAIARNDQDSFVFVKTAEIEKLIRLRAGGKIVGQATGRFPLQAIEDSLETFVGVSDAQVYFDNASRLQVRIEEQVPVARIFLEGGASYYLDSAAQLLPLSDLVAVDCPVFNGVRWTGNRPDSLQAVRIVSLARYIQADSFWSAQVGHFDLDEKGQFEMIPVAGNHRVQFGTAADPAASFRRLWLFYQQVLRPQGLDRYARIDVRYSGQVVASRTRFSARPDSVQLRKQVEQLIDAGMKADSTTLLNKPIKRAT